jgi:hypothetical protein
MKRIQLKDISRVLESALQACCAGFMTCTRALLPLHASAWKAVSEPVQNLLDANDAEQEHLVTLATTYVVAVEYYLHHCKQENNNVTHVYVFLILHKHAHHLPPNLLFDFFLISLSWKSYISIYSTPLP